MIRGDCTRGKYCWGVFLCHKQISFKIWKWISFIVSGAEGRRLTKRIFRTKMHKLVNMISLDVVHLDCNMWYLCFIKGYYGYTVGIPGTRVLPELLHSTRGDDGHDDPGQLHDQLHPLLHHVQTVQTNIQVRNPKRKNFLYLKQLFQESFPHAVSSFRFEWSQWRRSKIKTFFEGLRSCSGNNKQSPLENIYIEKYLMVCRWFLLKSTQWKKNHFIQK